MKGLNVQKRGNIIEGTSVQRKKKGTGCRAQMESLAWG